MISQNVQRIACNWLEMFSQNVNCFFHILNIMEGENNFKGVVEEGIKFLKHNL